MTVRLRPPGRESFSRLGSVQTNEINVQILLAEPATTSMQSWKASPPDFLAGFEPVDDSYNSLTYEKRFMEWPMKITNALSLGLFGRQGESIWRVTVRFDAEGEDRTKATLVGKLDEKTRAALGRWATERGQIIHDGGHTPP
jgi:hypothetical protein